jgi:hypothetical protein
MSRQGTSKGLDGLAGKPNASAAKSAAPAAAPKAIVAVDLKPSADAVRRKAYELYVERIAKGQPGDERTDWIRAERELTRH